MDERLSPARRLSGLPASVTPGAPGLPGPLTSPDAPEAARFPLPKRHRRFLACAAVVASVALGGLGVGATVETVQHETVASGPASH